MTIMASNFFVGKTASLPRPTADSPRPAGFGGTVEEGQKLWDQAERQRAENERLRDERIAGIEADRAAANQRRRDDQDAAFVDHLRRAYLAADPAATEADFQRDLAEIRRQHRIAAANGSAVPAETDRLRATGAYGIWRGHDDRPHRPRRRRTRVLGQLRRSQGQPTLSARAHRPIPGRLTGNRSRPLPSGDHRPRQVPPSPRRPGIPFPRTVTTAPGASPPRAPPGGGGAPPPPRRAPAPSSARRRARTDAPPCGDRSGNGSARGAGS
jgi:hypothetical protein